MSLASLIVYNSVDFLNRIESFLFERIKVYPSKEKVTCFYCDWNGRKDKAKDHCKEYHPGETFKLKLVENNMEKFFQRQINREAATTADVINDDVQEQEEQYFTVVSPSLSSLSISHVSPPPSTSICTSPTTNSVSDQLALVMEQLKKMTNAIDQIGLEKTKVQSLSSSSQSDDLEQMFQNITCSNDLYMLKHLEIDSQLDTITCILCSKFKKQALKYFLSTIKSSVGIFEYVEQDSHQIQSQ